MLLSGPPQTSSVTKYFIDKAADLDMRSSQYFEGAPQRREIAMKVRAGGYSISPTKRRASNLATLAMNFWQD